MICFAKDGTLTKAYSHRSRIAGRAWTRRRALAQPLNPFFQQTRGLATMRRALLWRYVTISLMPT
jgi:hypothetical protein